MKNADKQAHPKITEFTDGKTIFHVDSKEGLTKREYFAAIAMQGIIAGFDPESKVNGRFIPASDYPLLMQQAHQIADELLKQLDQAPSK